MLERIVADIQGFINGVRRGLAHTAVVNPQAQAGSEGAAAAAAAVQQALANTQLEWTIDQPSRAWQGSSKKDDLTVNLRLLASRHGVDCAALGVAVCSILQAEHAKQPDACPFVAEWLPNGSGVGIRLSRSTLIQHACQTALTERASFGRNADLALKAAGTVALLCYPSPRASNEAFDALRCGLLGCVYDNLMSLHDLVVSLQHPDQDEAAPAEKTPQGLAILDQPPTIPGCSASDLIAQVSGHPCFVRRPDGGGALDLSMYVTSLQQQTLQQEDTRDLGLDAKHLGQLHLLDLVSPTKPDSSESTELWALTSGEGCRLHRMILDASSTPCDLIVHVEQESIVTRRLRVACHALGRSRPTLSLTVIGHVIPSAPIQPTQLFASTLASATATARDRHGDGSAPEPPRESASLASQADGAPVHRQSLQTRPGSVVGTGDPTIQLAESVVRATIVSSVLGQSTQGNLDLNVPKVIGFQDGQYATGSTLIYNHGRLRSILTKYATTAAEHGLPSTPPLGSVRFDLLQENHEWEMLYSVVTFPDLIRSLYQPISAALEARRSSLAQSEPTPTSWLRTYPTQVSRVDVHKLVSHLYRLARCFSQYFGHVHVVVPRTDATAAMMDARIVLLSAVMQVFENGLNLLNIPRTAGRV
ncbi:hypothetical protein CAOG_00649 [Capsaspora owczarzaki ATCC 30864]|uniref:DALR anticodon binding domain-containing protein n=1 Tax=Capsaspora owczarzaki (strain ATCC 30864) TaxID=595528 RepID=A0A0D2VGV8_CAPO3|nr:hypothetical protein CAOG_00649 [Capsaspora owczarzaki ATCC 30864]KJE89102.1 hypothetical protein CAOG_000649 [Capsaspora owczarzaki ATCC 30864]|eukprot:XP_004365520.1 hypothetical protein CAOG_00649 [Capsaspora owczarzaki ATCC 30864]